MRGASTPTSSQWLMYVQVADLEASLQQMRRRRRHAGHRDQGRAGLPVLRDSGSSRCGDGAHAAGRLPGGGEGGAPPWIADF